ncbi:MAG: cytosine permease [Actinobacteria bacterium]|jgi:NCS1 family nucleobase:cation symporter-1|nr:cytosine permease [Actinomycetota bacterium]
MTMTPVMEKVPTHERDLTIEQRGLIPVSEHERYGRTFRIFTMWLSPQFTPSAFFIGAIAAAIGLGFWWAFAAIIIGNILGALPVAALSTWGPRTGMGQLPLTRAAFGKSTVLPGVVMWATTLGWVAFNNVFGATALRVLFHAPYWLGLLLIFAGEAVIAVFGHEMIHTFEKWMSWVLGIIFLGMTIKLIISGGTTALGSSVKGGMLIGTFFLMVVIAGSDGYAWAPYASDYSRYLPSTTSRRKVFWYTFAGIAGGLTWMELLGLTVAHRVISAGTLGTASTIWDLMGKGGFAVIAMIAIYLATVAVDVVNDYTGSLSLQAAGIHLRRPYVAFINATCAFALSAWFLYAKGALYDKVENLLLFFTYWISAWLGIVVVDWIRRKGSVHVGELSSWQRLHWNWASIIAFVLGFIASIPFSNTTAGYDFVQSHPSFKYIVGYVPFHLLDQADIGFIVAFVISALVYGVLQRSPATSVPSQLQMDNVD